MSELVLERPAPTELDAARLLIEALLGSVQTYNADLESALPEMDRWSEAVADACFWAEMTFVWGPAKRAGALYDLYCVPGEAVPDQWLCSPLPCGPVAEVLETLDDLDWRLRPPGDEAWRAVVAAAVAQWEAWRRDLESGVAA